MSKYTSTGQKIPGRRSRGETRKRCNAMRLRRKTRQERRGIAQEIAAWRHETGGIW